MARGYRGLCRPNPDGTAPGVQSRAYRSGRWSQDHLCGECDRVFGTPGSSSRPVARDSQQHHRWEEVLAEKLPMSLGHSLSVDGTCHSMPLCID